MGTTTSQPDTNEDAKKAVEDSSKLNELQEFDGLNLADSLRIAGDLLGDGENDSTDHFEESPEVTPYADSADDSEESIDLDPMVQNEVDSKELKRPRKRMKSTKYGKDFLTGEKLKQEVGDYYGVRRKKLTVYGVQDELSIEKGAFLVIEDENFRVTGIFEEGISAQCILTKPLFTKTNRIEASQIPSLIFCEQEAYFSKSELESNCEPLHPLQFYYSFKTQNLGSISSIDVCDSLLKLCGPQDMDVRIADDQIVVCGLHDDLHEVMDLLITHNDLQNLLRQKEPTFTIIKPTVKKTKDNGDPHAVVLNHGKCDCCGAPVASRSKYAKHLLEEADCKEYIMQKIQEYKANSSDDVEATKLNIIRALHHGVSSAKGVYRGHASTPCTKMNYEALCGPEGFDPGKNTYIRNFTKWEDFRKIFYTSSMLWARSRNRTKNIAIDAEHPCTFKLRFYKHPLGNYHWLHITFCMG